MVMTLPPLEPPPSRSEDIRRVRFRHPAYPDFEPDLLLLNAVDGDGAGIDYDTAFVACCIVTGNRWDDGWLAQREDVQSNEYHSGKFSFTRVSRPDDGILQGDIYYFLIGDHAPNYKYPVHPSFDHWRFPHGRLPPPWTDLRIPRGNIPPSLKQATAAIGRDGTCRVSGYREGLDVAHIVPLSSGHWFTSNAMTNYCRLNAELNPIDDDRNLLLLRKDIHHLMDQRRFTFIPRASGASDNPPQLASHVLLAGEAGELIQLYHNRAPQSITGISVEFLFARFAWSIFTDVIMPLFRGSQDYAVLVFDLQSGKHITRRLHSPQIRNTAALFGSYSGSRSVSPRKRTINDVSQDAWGDHEPDDTNYTVDHLMDAQFQSPQEEEPRGRRRKRSWDYAHNSPPDLARSITSAATSQEVTDNSLDSATPIEFHAHRSHLVEDVRSNGEKPRKRRSSRAVGQKETGDEGP